MKEMGDENREDESMEDSSNMISKESFENALKQRLAEQSRKHQRELRRKEEEMENLRNQYQNFDNTQNEDSDIATKAAQNVVNPEVTPGSYISADKLPEIFDQYDQYKIEQDRRHRQEEQQRRNSMAYQQKEAQIIKEVEDSYEKDHELQDLLKKHGNNREMLEQLGHYLTFHPAQKAPLILKNILTNENNFKKFNDPDSNFIKKGELIADIASNIAADKLAKSLPRQGGNFAIRETAASKKSPSTTAELRADARKKGLYSL